VAEAESAIDQVVNAANNFGTTFSSTEMIFAGQTSQENKETTPIETDKNELLNKKL